MILRRAVDTLTGSYLDRPNYDGASACDPKLFRQHMDSYYFIVHRGHSCNCQV